MGGRCVATFDSFYAWTLVFGASGLVWMWAMRGLVDRLIHTPKKEWYLNSAHLSGQQQHPLDVDESQRLQHHHDHY